MKKLFVFFFTPKLESQQAFMKKLINFSVPFAVDCIKSSEVFQIPIPHSAVGAADAPHCALYVERDYDCLPPAFDFRFSP